jgi:hypothetical protein
MPSSKNRAGRAIVFALGLSLCALSAVDLSHAQSAPKPPPVVTAAKQYKNIQVLKDLPADQLIPTMRFFAESLGERCSFCHVQGDFASDAKPQKKTARQMILMTKDINKRHKVVMNHVTCYTCHRGNDEPVNAPPKRSGE